MQNEESLVAVFTDHSSAEAAVNVLLAAGFSTQNLSVVGKGSQTDEKTIIHEIGDRLKFWGKRGAFWGGLWSLFFGGLFVAFPEVGIVIVLGYLAATTISAVESESLVDGLGTLEKVLTDIGVSLAHARLHETAVKADGILVLAHGTPNEIAGARSVLIAAGAASTDVHAGLQRAAGEPR